MTIMIGVSRDVELDPDKAVHIMHITVRTSAVRLVGKKSAMEFDMFTMSLYQEDMGLTSISSRTRRKCTPSPRRIGRASEKGTSDQGGGDVFT